MTFAPVLSSAILGIAVPDVRPMISAIIFGLIGIVLTIIGYKLFDIAATKIDVQKELCEKNIAVAIVVAAIIIGVAIVVSSAITG